MIVMSTCVLIGVQRHTPKSRDLYGMWKNWLSDQNQTVDDTSPYISLILGVGTSLALTLSGTEIYFRILVLNKNTYLQSCITLILEGKIIH